jgi:hypothetical protein
MLVLSPIRVVIINSMVNLIQVSSCFIAIGLLTKTSHLTKLLEAIEKIPIGMRFALGILVSILALITNVLFSR